MDAIKALNLWKKLGDPVEIIGVGYVANTLRKKYGGEETHLSIADLSRSCGGKIVSIEKFDKVMVKIKKELKL